MTGLIRGIARGKEWILFATERIAALLFGLIFAVNVIHILARPVNGGWIWVGDLSQLMFAWMIMLAAGVAYGRNDHIVVDFLIDRLPSVADKTIHIFITVCEFLIGVILLVAGWTVAIARMNISYIQLDMPTGWTFMSVPALGLLMLLFSVTKTVQPEDTSQAVPEN